MNFIVNETIVPHQFRILRELQLAGFTRELVLLPMYHLDMNSNMICNLELLVAIFTIKPSLGDFMLSSDVFVQSTLKAC
jgi:hypothetical protein